jgi:hypothetical protein
MITSVLSQTRLYDLQNFRKRIFLGDDQGELSKGTVQLVSSRSLELNASPTTTTEI